ncbi:MAG: chromosome segregation protein SMC [Balneolales bacterium]|nr:chromosome segregation protein SMC [Balneolales bacterium]
MYLSELALHGFKSFANKTTVRFDSGITGIVGPNGCGKSNIVDALRWVLGEQRASLLRSGAMQSVIFNGTANKKPLGMAEVSLTIQNSKGILPLEYTEVTISRRLYRSGESEYLLNGSVCRLKDIVELFMDTGMGPGAYSVIELKMVEEILNDKNNDRRRLFEEAAGVTRYKEKRKQTLRKLDETVEDLQRVEDILVEIRKKTRSLQLQADKAKRAKEYHERLEKLDLAWSRFEYLNLQEKLVPLQDRIVTVEKEKNQLEQEYSALEEVEVLAQEKLVEREKMLSVARQNLNEISSKFRETETTIRINKEKIRNEGKVIFQFEQDIDQAENDITDLKRTKVAAENTLKEKNESLLHSSENLDNYREIFKNIDLEAGELRRKVNNFKREQDALANQINQLQSTKIRLESRLESLREDQQRIVLQQEELEEQLMISGKDVEILDSQMHEQKEKYRLAEEKLEHIRAEKDRAQTLLSDLKDQLREANSKKDALESEKELVEQIVRSHDAFPGSVQFVLSEARKLFGKDNGKYQVLTDVLSTDQAHAVALEAALGDACYLIVADDDNDTQQAFSWLREQKKGRVSMVSVSHLAQVKQNGRVPDLHENSIAWQVACPAGAEPIRDLLLHNICLADSFDQAVVRAAESEGLSWVTPGGDLVTSQQIRKSGSLDKNVGLRVGLKDRLSGLEQEISAATEKAARLDSEITKTAQFLHELDESSAREVVRTTEQQLRRTEQRRTATLSERELYQKSKAEQTQRLETLDNQIKQGETQLAEVIPRFDELNYQIETIIEEQLKMRNELRSKEEARQRAQQSMNDARVKEQQLRSEAEAYEREIAKSAESVQTIKTRLDQRAAQAKESREKIQKLTEETEELEYYLDELADSRNKSDQQYKEAEEATAQQRGKIRQLEDQLRQSVRKKEINTGLLHQLQIEESRFEMQVKSLSDHVWETYSKMMEQLEEDFPEEVAPEEAKREIQKLKERLKTIGEVNPLAIDQYEEEKERLDFYEGQVADLKEAEQKLRNTIKEINETASDRFLQTFEQIRTHFKRVFSMLFMEDDFCDLLLEEKSDDPLDHKIEIIAKPRGKRPSNIEQLSGGEKTLTAIALLFSIYLVKPSPFCILDEVDAPLDDANVERFTGLIRQFSEDTQFIVITHNKKTMEKAEVMYGVTMQETGVSRLVGVRLDGKEVA